MRRFCFWSPFFILLLLACGRITNNETTATPPAIPLSPTLTEVAAASLTPFLAATPSQTAFSPNTTQPAATPQPSLASPAPDTPLLFYFKSGTGTPEHRLMVWMNLAGQVFDSWELTDHSQWLTANSVSPDGQWLAYYMDTAGGGCLDIYNGGLSGPPYSLSLHLFGLPHGETLKFISRLLPPDYPNNFATDALASSETRLNTFLCGIASHQWSPDGRYLAFASGVDGPSSDLYVYDMSTGTVTRLSSGAEQLLWLSWSPDGQWILHTSAHQFNEAGDGTIGNYHAAHVDGSNVVSLPSEGIQRWLGWLTDNSYWVADGENGIGMFNLRQITIPGGEIKTLWPGVYDSVALDREMNQLLVTGTDVAGTPGLFRVNLIDLSFELIASGDFHGAEFAGLGELRFIVRADTGVQQVWSDGRLTTFGSGDASVRGMALSSDGQKLAVLQDGKMIWLGRDGVLLAQFVLPELVSGREAILWWPDSQGLFFTLNSSLYLLAGPDATPLQVDTNIPHTFALYARWLE